VGANSVSASCLSSVAIQYYVDADSLGLAHILVTLRSDVTFPGDLGGAVGGVTRPACPVTSTATKDTVWIPIVAAAQWIIITRDRAIQRRPHELYAVTHSSARMIVISSNEVLTKWHQLEIVMCQWRRIEALGPIAGPWIYTVTRTSMTKVV
jgi:PIN domain-containing protein